MAQTGPLGLDEKIILLSSGLGCPRTVHFILLSYGCQYQERDKTCAHCDRFEIALNVNVSEVCIDEKDFPTESFKFYDFSSYAKTLPGNPFFVYNKDLNCIVRRIDAIDWGDFFVGNETM